MVANARNVGNEPGAVRAFGEKNVLIRHSGQSVLLMVRRYLDTTLSMHWPNPSSHPLGNCDWHWIRSERIFLIFLVLS